MSFWRGMFGLPVATKKDNSPNMMRGYVAAAKGRLFSDFKGSGSSADSELLHSLETMRNRSRELERNEPFVRRFFDLMRVNVVGKQGLRLQVKARNFRSNQLDTVGNALIEGAWNLFCATGNCTADGRMSMRELCELILVGANRDGEQFIQVVKGSQFKHGMAFHPFEPDLIDERKNVRLGNGNRVRMGVEVDPYNRPVAYWVRGTHPGDHQLGKSIYSEERRIPAENIIHVMIRRRAGQTRGEPVLAPVVTTMKMLNGHREAELVASRIAAAKMGFFTREGSEEFPADDYDEQEAPLMDVEPGTFHNLPQGMSFSSFDPTHPSTAFGDFQKNIIRSIAMGLGVSYESLSGDLEGVSYSSIRQGSIQERDFYSMMQMWFVEQAMMPMFSTWLEHCLDFGLLGNLPPSRYDKFFPASSFRGRGWQWVDPEKEIRAAREGIHLGVSSMSEIAAEQGKDIEEVFSQHDRDKQLAEQYDLSLEFEPFGAPAGKKTPEKPVKNGEVEEKPEIGQEEEEEAE